MAKGRSALSKLQRPGDWRAWMKSRFFPEIQESFLCPSWKYALTNICLMENHLWSLFQFPRGVGRKPGFSPPWKARLTVDLGARCWRLLFFSGSPCPDSHTVKVLEHLETKSTCAFPSWSTLFDIEMGFTPHDLLMSSQNSWLIVYDVDFNGRISTVFTNHCNLWQSVR